MKNLYRKQADPVASRWSFALLLGLVVALAAGCEPDEDDGDIVGALLLPTDNQLTLECPDAGVYTESCILDDPQNPYRDALITEFDVNTQTEANKFDFLAAIDTARPSAAGGGAKSRFYLWATALAKRSSGENQWYTARAIHELWTTQPVGSRDPVLREQALKAYRSVLDNYFDEVTFFDFPLGDPISVLVRKLAAFDLLCPTATLNDLFQDPDPLSPPQVRQAGQSFVVEGLLADWGFTYNPPAAFRSGKTLYIVDNTGNPPNTTITLLATDPLPAGPDGFPPFAPLPPDPTRYTAKTPVPLRNPGPGLMPNPDLPIIGSKPPFVCNYTEIVSPPNPTPPFYTYTPVAVAEDGSFE